MSLVVCLNALGETAFLDRPLQGGRTCIDLVCDRLTRMPSFSKVVVLHRGEVVPALAGIRARFDVPVEFSACGDSLASSVFEALTGHCGTGDQILFLRADAPLVSPVMAAKIYENMQKWHAEYSFADGFPEGYCPEYIKAGIVPILLRLCQTKNVDFAEPNALFELIKVEINSFEIETEIASRDLRMLRIHMFCNNLRNTLLCGNLLPYAELEPPVFLDTLLVKQEGLRTLPAYFPIQISAACPQVCVYCPWGQRGPGILTDKRFMPAFKIRELCEKIEAFAPDSIVSMSLWGEPSLHPEIGDIIADFGRRHRSLKLYIETSGLGWDGAILEKLAAQGAGHVTWIVSLDSNDPATYAAMRGTGFEEALASAHRFVQLFGQRTYIQAVRTKTGEEKLAPFYQYWKKLGANVVIQKYDHFSRKLPDLRMTDISPLERNVCWHIKRDFHVLIDGAVPRCREDVDRGDILGNAFDEELTEIWERQLPLYDQQVKGLFPGICEHCDEYYTFNN